VQVQPYTVVSSDSEDEEPVESEVHAAFELPLAPPVVVQL
jgi:hypothetical protein